MYHCLIFHLASLTMIKMAANNTPPTIPLIYLFLYKRIKDKFGFRIADIKALKECIKRNVYNLPWNYHSIIIHEMSQLDMLKKVDRNNFQILRLKINCERTLKQFENFFW